MKKILKRILIIFASLSVLIAALSLGYYLVVFIPNKEEARQALEKAKLEQVEKEHEIELQKQEEEKRVAEEEAIQQQKVASQRVARQKTLLQECLNNAFKTYNENWNTYCPDFGQESGCKLPPSLSDSLNKHYESAKNDCFKMYPVN